MAHSISFKMRDRAEATARDESTSSTVSTSEVRSKGTASPFRQTHDNNNNNNDNNDDDAKEGNNDEEGVNDDQLHLQRGVGDGRSFECLAETKLCADFAQDDASSRSYRPAKGTEGEEKKEEEIEENVKEEGVNVEAKGKEDRPTAAGIQHGDKEGMGEEGKGNGPRDDEREEGEEEEEEVTLESLHTSPPGLDRHLMDRICNLVAGKARPVFPPARVAGAVGDTGTASAASSAEAPIPRNKDNNNNNNTTTNNKNAAPIRPNVLPSDIYR